MGSELSVAPLGVGGKWRPLDDITALLAISETVAGVSRAAIPTIQDEVIVEVVGQPGSSKQELYFLALAAANGIIRRVQPLLQLNPFLPPSAGTIMIEYDAADHWVRCTMMYRMAAIAGTVGIDTGIKALRIARETIRTDPFAVVKDLAKGFFTVKLANDTLGKAFMDNAAVYRGPQCEVVGGKFDFTDGGAFDLLAGPIGIANFIGALPGVPHPNNAPFLPWSGRTILTSCPQVNDPAPIPAIKNKPPATPPKLPGPPIDSPNPTPVGDHRSRGAVVAKPGSGSEGEGVLRAGGQGARNPNAPAGPMGAWGPEGIGAGGGVLDAGLNAAGAGHCCDKALLLEELVFASLTNPGSFSNETWTAPTQNTTGR